MLGERVSLERKKARRPVAVRGQDARKSSGCRGVFAGFARFGVGLGHVLAAGSFGLGAAAGTGRTLGGAVMGCAFAGCAVSSGAFASGALSAVGAGAFGASRVGGRGADAGQRVAEGPQRFAAFEFGHGAGIEAARASRFTAYSGAS